MPSTHTALHYHIVFATKNREPLMDADWRDQLHRTICKIAGNKGYRVEAIGGMPDHIHILLKIPATEALAHAVNVIKSNSSRYIKEQDLCAVRFSWQEGYGAFTVSQSNLDDVKQYILNQPEHHKQRSFADEYSQMLKRHGFSEEVHDVA